MNVEIITIGNEVITGHIADTNAAFLADTVFSLGAKITRIVSVGDEVDIIAEVLQQAMTRADLILVTGGLGPTPDDRTPEAAAHALERELAVHEESLETLKEKFRRRDFTFTRSDEKQALLPRGAEPLPNPIGLCGFKIEEGAKTIFFFPGVPREMKGIVEETLIPFLQKRMYGKQEIVKSEMFKVYGMGEARVKEIIEGIEDNIELAYLPSFPEIHLRVIVRGADEKEIVARHNQCEKELYGRLGDYLYGKGDEVLESVVGRLLRERKATLAVAESCTGGLIAHRITEIPGSSDYFLRGVVAYNNKTKEELLGVSSYILKKYGPVSKEVAEQMAMGVQERSGATIGLATTGIAGPAGAAPKTPVGRVFIALSAEDRSEVKQYDFFGDRHAIKLMASAVALDRVRRYLLGI